MNSVQEIKNEKQKQLLQFFLAEINNFVIEIEFVLPPKKWLRTVRNESYSLCMFIIAQIIALGRKINVGDSRIN